MPRMEPGAVLLETLYSEVCGTDVHLHKGQLAGVPYPIIPGHVSVGRVLEVCGSSTDINGRSVQPGQTVTFLDVHETCNNCWHCLVAKNSTRCPKRKVYGITYSANEGLLGGWAQNIYLKPGVKTIILPDSVTPECLISGGCGLPTSIHAMERAQIPLGSLVAIQGSGPVGLNAAILAQISGAGGVLVIGDPDVRLQTALDFGADAVISVAGTTPEERIERVRAWSNGRGADITIEAAGVPSAVVEGMRMTRDGGRYVIVGQYTDAGNAEINPHLDINRRHLEIRGCWGSDFSHFYRMVQVLARYGSRIPWERMISRYYGLHEMNQALADVAEGHIVKAVVSPRLGTS
jgi:threonine dehydrogenase-like Zn-dependent dehydrogenase